MEGEARQIDWLSLRVDCTHKRSISGNRIVEVTPQGEVVFSLNKRRSVEGSHATNLAVRTVADQFIDERYRVLEVSGNPTKWLQGHNVFGVLDAVALAHEVMERLVPILGLTPTETDRYSWSVGAPLLTRIDIAAMFELGSRHEVLAWLRAALHGSHMSHRGGAVSKGSTLYWGKNSRRWSLKAYSKGQELSHKGHMLPPDLPLREELAIWADNKLRIELVLRSMELKRIGMERVAAFGDTLGVSEMFSGHLSRLRLSDQYSVPQDVLDGLPPAARVAYLAWKAGEDVRSQLPRASFYRYRAQLLPFGVDLAVRQGPDRGNVVPLIRVLEAKPASVPDWVRGTSLYWEPRRRA